MLDVQHFQRALLSDTIDKLGRPHDTESLRIPEKISTECWSILMRTGHNFTL
jgi:hypothetical protein